MVTRIAAEEFSWICIQLMDEELGDQDNPLEAKKQRDNCLRRRNSRTHTSW